MYIPLFSIILFILFFTAKWLHDSLTLVSGFPDVFEWKYGSLEQETWDFLLVMSFYSVDWSLHMTLLVHTRILAVMRVLRGKLPL
jgi:hypothetical protein